MCFIDVPKAYCSVDIRAAMGTIFHTDWLLTVEVRGSVVKLLSTSMEGHGRFHELLPTSRETHGNSREIRWSFVEIRWKYIEASIEVICMELKAFRRRD